jgi:uncharacterized damage-inducible protein DinB
MATEEQLEIMILRFSAIIPRILFVTHSKKDTATRTAAKGQWSIHDVLDHLRASYDIISYRIYAALVRENPPVAAFDERQWAILAHYSTLEFNASLETFSRLRDELLVTLQSLTPADWERTVQHETNGTMTLWTMMEHMVSHEEEHCEQIEKIVLGTEF